MRRLVWLVVLISAVVLAVPAMAQQQDNRQATTSPLVQLLQSKGILTADEAAMVNQASSPGEANQRLAQLLLAKGVITQEDYKKAFGASEESVATDGAGGAHLMSAVVHVGNSGAAANSGAIGGSAAPAPAAPKEPPVVPAIAPIRVLPIGIPRQGGSVIPDIKLSSGALINLYGFFKASAVYDSTNSGGAVFGSNDFPLPLLLGDTGPDSGSQFRTKARSARFGANVSYPLDGPNLTLTGKIEFDWEGDYTVANNRNISSVRSSQASLRLAWARLDGKMGTVPWFAEFGQDWTLLGSSTVMDLFETTGFAVGFGNFYERVPQIKGGLQFTAGRFKIEPEAAVTLGAFGDNNLNNTAASSLTGLVGQIPVGEQDQGRFGAVLGQASGHPGVQGRIVLDFPLNTGWKGVQNAELIFSGGHADAREILPVGNIPATNIPGLTCPGGAAACNLRAFFPHGLALNIPQNAWSAEVQLPTPWVTVVSKYYRGGDLRFMFAGQLNTAFVDTSGGSVIALPPATLVCAGGSAGCSSQVVGTNGTITLAQNAWSFSGDPITFVKNSSGAAVVAPLRPIRGQGGLFQLGFPLSRIFGASPEGLNTGWTFYAGYGVDSALARDVRRTGGNNLLRSDYIPVSLRYKINKWAQLVDELTYYDTRTVGSKRVLFRGVDARVNHDWRQEFGTVFTF